MILVRYRNLTREHEIEASEDLDETVIGHISLSDITKSQSSVMYVKTMFKIFNKFGKSVILYFSNYVHRTTNIKNNINEGMITLLNPQKLK